MILGGGWLASASVILGCCLLAAVGADSSDDTAVTNGQPRPMYEAFREMKRLTTNISLDGNNPSFTGDVSVGPDYHTEWRVHVDLPPGHTVQIDTRLVTTNELGRSSTVDIVAKQTSASIYWKLQDLEGQDHRIKKESDIWQLRTLCPSNHTLRIFFSKGNEDENSFLEKVRVTVSLIEFEIDLDSETTISKVSSAAPALRAFIPPPTYDPAYKDIFVMLRNNSKAMCSVFAILPYKQICPDGVLPYIKEDVMFVQDVLYQTALDRAAIPLFMSESYQSGYLVVILTQESDAECHSLASSKIPSGLTFKETEYSHANFTLIVKSVDNITLEWTFYVLGVHVASGIIGLLFALYFCGKHRLSLLDKETEIIPMEEIKSQVDEDSEVPSTGTIENGEQSKSQHRSPENKGWSERVDTFEKMGHKKQHHLQQGYGIKQDPEETSDLNPSDQIIGIKLDEEKIRKEIKEKRKYSNTVADFSSRYHQLDTFLDTNHIRSGLYMWLAIMAGIFYALPVLQLVMYHEETAVKLGNLDICYYNFECIAKVGVLLDYANVFSNIGYILGGIFFLLITYLRSKRYLVFLQRSNKMNVPSAEKTGVPEQYGLYYGMGVALIGEGVLSACYHVCPTGINFQFDTTFMYIIALLIFLKVYQFRHPDFTPSASKTYILIGIILYIEVAGYLVDNVIFWTFFIVFYLVIIFTVILGLYSRENGLTFQEWIERVTCKNCKSTIETYFCNASLCSHFRQPVLLVLAANLAVAGYIALRHTPGVSTYILLIISLNMIMYLTYYLYCKMYYRYSKKMESEGVRIPTLIYIALSMVCMGSSGYFFLSLERNTGIPAAESRILNRECIVGIFDNHDLWHFLSAMGIFWGYMFLLTLEDMNVRQPRDEIPAF